MHGLARIYVHASLAHACWLPQKHGDLAHIKTMFAAQMHYLEAYLSVIPALSKDDG